MSQSSLLGKDCVEKSLGAVVSKMRIKIPKFDNSVLIKAYTKTMIGRCMNPRKQDMKGLLLMFPRICQIEGRVAGADIGLGRFQLDFDEEKDIAEVLMMEPFHFDGWMVSLVRWKPSVDPAYPSSLTFWIRVLGIPIEYWAAPTFKAIGDALGKVVEVDVDVGRVQVVVDGFKPLCFETTIEFDSGEETLISLRYKRLYGYCNYCFSMCHDVEHCEKKNESKKAFTQSLESGDGAGSHHWSYKGAVTQAKHPHLGYEGKGKGIAIGRDREDEGNVQFHHGNEGKGKGVAVGRDRAEERKVPHNSESFGRQSRFAQGEGSSRYRRFTNCAQFNDHRAMKAKMKEVTKVKVADTTEVHVVPPEVMKPKNLVRKSLVFDTETNQISEHKQQDAAENQAAGLVMGSMTAQLPSQSDPEEGELNLSTTIAASSAAMESVEVENAEDTVMKDSDQFLPESFSEELSEALWDHTDENFMFQDNETFDSLEAILEGGADGVDGNNDLPNMGSATELDEGVVSDTGKESQAGKKKNGKGTMLLSGVNSRKRNVQVLVTLRKRSAPKDGASIGDGANPKNQDKEKGNPGGPKPPKPSA